MPNGTTPLSNGAWSNFLIAMFPFNQMVLVWRKDISRYAWFKTNPSEQNRDIWWVIVCIGLIEEKEQIRCRTELKYWMLACHESRRKTRHCWLWLVGLSADQVKTTSDWILSRFHKKEWPREERNLSKVPSWSSGSNFAQVIATSSADPKLDFVFFFFDTKSW